MRRRLQLSLVAALAVGTLTIVLVTGGPQARHGPERAARVPRDSVARPDSVGPAASQPDEDLPCLASHLGLPCR